MSPLRCPRCGSGPPCTCRRLPTGQTASPANVRSTLRPNQQQELVRLTSEMIHSIEKSARELAGPPRPIVPAQPQRQRWLLESENTRHRFFASDRFGAPDHRRQSRSQRDISAQELSDAMQSVTLGEVLGQPSNVSPEIQTPHFNRQLQASLDKIREEQDRVLRRRNGTCRH